MRIIGGTYRNRRLNPPMEMAARPTTDFAKEGLFNVLHHGYPLEGIRVLDLFAGTGSISLEFLSRGAAEVVSVEQERKLIAFMERTGRELGVTGWRQVNADVFSFLRTHCAFAKPPHAAEGFAKAQSAKQGRARYDIVFADPPFHMDDIGRIATLVLEAGLLEDDGVLILEHMDRLDLSHLPGYQQTRKYGLVHFSFFHPVQETRNTP